MQILQAHLFIITFDNKITELKKFLFFFLSGDQPFGIGYHFGLFRSQVATGKKLISRPVNCFRWGTGVSIENLINIFILIFTRWQLYWIMDMRSVYGSCITFCMMFYNVHVHKLYMYYIYMENE